MASVLKDALFREAFEACDGAVSLQLESSSRELLNEYGGTQSHLDAVMKFSGLNIVVESKLFEQLGGCSQVKQGHCSGEYGVGSDLKLKTQSACRLDYQDGSRTRRLYWDIMTPISNKDAYVDGEPCPFAGGGYQVMRNISAAVKLADSGTKWRVVFALPQSADSKSVMLISQVKSRLVPEHQSGILILDYFQLAKELMNSRDTVARGLGEYMTTRLYR